VAIKLLVAMMRQELMVTAHPDQACDAVAERLKALLAQPQPFVADDRPITVESLGRPAASVQRTPLLGIRRPEQQVEPGAASAAEHAPPETPIPLGIRPRSGGRPGSSA